MAKITKLIKGLLTKDLGALGNLEETKSAGALVPLDKQEVAPSRREFLKKAGGAVAQSALPNTAISIVTDALVKAPSSPLALDILNMPRTKERIDEYLKEGVIDEIYMSEDIEDVYDLYTDDDLDDHVNQIGSSERIDALRGDPDMMKEAVLEAQELYPDIISGSEEIFRID